MNGFANVVEIDGGQVWAVTIDGSCDPVDSEHFLKCGSEREARDLVAVLHRMETYTAERIAKWFERDSAYAGCREVIAIRAGTYHYHEDPKSLDPDLAWPVPI